MDQSDTGSMSIFPRWTNRVAGPHLQVVKGGDIRDGRGELAVDKERAAAVLRPRDERRAVELIQKGGVRHVPCALRAKNLGESNSSAVKNGFLRA
eukprot:711133-Prorocentrum_minimum.AAC.1